MWEKIKLTFLTVIVCMGMEALSGQDVMSEEGANQAQEGPQASPAGFREAFSQWFEDLGQAYEQKDSEKIGRLIGEMRENRQKWQRGGGGSRRRVRFGQDQPRVARGESPKMEQASMISRQEEKKFLGLLEDLHQNQRRGMMNVPLEDGRLLRLLTQATGAKHVVEIGTSNGYSSIWICLGLKTTGGRLITHEIDEDRAALARKNFKRAGVEKLITLVMGNAHETVKDIEEPIDILFIDADKEGYIDYLQKLLPKVRPGGLICAHNTNMRGAMKEYLEAVTTDPDLETLFLHEQGAGMSVTLKKR